MRNALKNMELRKIALYILCLSACYANAQTRGYGRHYDRKQDTISLFVKAYEDSLMHSKLCIDSLKSEERTVTSAYAGDSYRLFAPITFYRDVVAGKLHADDNMPASQQATNDCLFDIYIKRPDLVMWTQKQIEKETPVLPQKPYEVVPDVDIIDKLSPKAEDTDIAPVDIFVKKPNFWNVFGDYGLQLFQNYVSTNWYKGGESNYSLLATLTLQANYNNKKKFRWENKLEMRLGIQSSRADTLHKVKTSEDLLRYTGKVGLQATKKWYYTLQIIASTQFMRGLKSNDDFVYSDFLSPFTFNPSIGMDYGVNWFKGRISGSIHLAPFAYNMKYVKRDELVTRYGIEEGKHVLHDFGSEFIFDLNFAFTKDIKWKTRLYGYTTYKRTLMEWENTFTFIVNRYITSNLFVYPRFDDGTSRDSHHGYWQLKEYISLGFNYNF